MAKDEIKNIWQSANPSVKHFNKEEIVALFQKKSRNIMRRFILWFIISISLSTGLFLYLVITSILRFDDLYFVSLNLLLIILTVYFLIGYVKGYVKIYTISTVDGTLEENIQQKISLLKRYLTGSKLSSLIIIPFVILLIISINVFFEKEQIIEVLSNDNSTWGLIFGGIIGITAALLASKKMRRYYEANLTRLENNLKEIRNLV